MYGRWGILIVRLILLLIAAVLSALALSYSFVGEYLGKAIKSAPPVQSEMPIISLFNRLSTTTSAFVAVLIVLLLVIIVPFCKGRARDVKLMAVPLLLLNIPGILSHSSLDWSRFLLGKQLSYTVPPPIETIAFSIATASCLLLLYLVTQRREDILVFEQQKVEETDRLAYVRGSLRLILDVLGGAVAMTTIILIVVFTSHHSFDAILRFVPWPVVVLGLSGVGILVVVIYLMLFYRSRVGTEDSAQQQIPPER